jgi:hypothetical protein
MVDEETGLIGGVEKVVVRIVDYANAKTEVIEGILSRCRGLV